MGTDSKKAKTNEQYLAELQEGKDCIINLHFTPYSYLAILFDPREEDASYKDDDGDWIHRTRTVIDRKALIKIEDGKYSFLIDNWFDDIDCFENGLYAKVRLGGLYNLITPTGGYLFPDWKGDIEFHGHNLIYCYKTSLTNNLFPSVNTSNQHKKVERSCSIFDRRGQILFDNVIVKTDFINGEALIYREGLYNYINENGALLMSDWLLEAKTFDKTHDGVFAFVKDKKGWSLIDEKGCFLSAQRYSLIKHAEWHSYRYSSRPIAIVEDETGQNILMSEGGSSKTGSLILGFRESVESIVLVGSAFRILARHNGIWNLYEWDYNNCVFKFEKELGEFEIVGDSLFAESSEYYRIIRKDGLYNVVDSDGIHFSEWYSELLVIGGLLRIRRDSTDYSADKTIQDTVDSLKYEYNLLRYNGSYVLDEWVNYITATPIQDYLILNVKPTISKRRDGAVIDQSITYSNVGPHDESKRIIASVKGCCNLLSEGLLFDDWYDTIEFLNGNVFTNGFVKVWKDGKCNLVNKNKEYVSPIWVDDFKTSRWHPTSYFSEIIENAYEVSRDGKVNLLKNGKFLFSQWFSSIAMKEKNDYFRVHDNNLVGLFSLKSGLYAGRLFDSIERISDTLYFGRYNDEGLILNLSGSIVSRGPIASVGQFKDGYAKIFTGQPGRGDNSCKYNYINTLGEIISTVWYDYDRYRDYDEDHVWRSEQPTPPFKIVMKDGKYNLITPDKLLVFKKWYDSISGQDGKWLVSDIGKGDSKYTFIDNEEHRLTEDWFDDAYTLNNFKPGVYVVERNEEYNVFNLDNEYTFDKWTKLRIVDDGFTGLVVAPVYPWGVSEYFYFINSKGNLISPYFGRKEDVTKFYRRNEDYGEYILILPLYEKDVHGGWMDLICKEDGTPLLYDIKNHDYIRTGLPYGSESIFGDIEEFVVPGKGQLLLVDKHWPVHNNDKRQYVIMDFDGNVLSEEFEKIGKFDDDGFSCVERNGLYNVINSDFHLVSPIWFSSVGFEYKAKETEYDEYLDDESGMVQGREYQVERIRRDTSFHDGLLKVELAGAYNFINQSGKVRFPIWYDSLYYASNDYYKVSLDGLYNVIDAQGNAISDIWFDRMAICKKNYDVVIYACKKDDLYKLLIVRSSSAILSNTWVDKVARYDKANSYYSVRLKGKKNFITDEGKLLMPGWHDDQLLYRNYRGVHVVVKDGDKYNIYSSNEDRFLSDTGFDSVLASRDGLFNHGWCGVKIDGKYTFINEKGELISDCLYDSVREFQNGYAGIIQDGKMNYLSSNGSLLSDVWYDEISAFTSQRKALVRINGNLNIVDSSGSLLLPEEIGLVTSISFVDSKYCKLSFEVGEGKTSDKYFDYQTAHLHNSEWEVIDIIEANEAKEKSDEEGLKTENGSAGESTLPAHIRSQIKQLMDDGGIPGLSFTLIKFGNKSNLVDKEGLFLFEEWIDSSSIQMHQGVALLLTKEGKWVIVN